MKHCTICKTLLNRPDDPTTEDCGGDCLRCMAEAGDPECLMSMLRIRSASRFFSNFTPSDEERMRASALASFPGYKCFVDRPVALSWVSINEDGILESVSYFRPQTTVTREYLESMGLKGLFVLPG